MGAEPWPMQGRMIGRHHACLFSIAPAAQIGAYPGLAEILLIMAACSCSPWSLFNQNRSAHQSHASPGSPPIHAEPSLVVGCKTWSLPNAILSCPGTRPMKFFG
jgi:hypothetical protein